MKALVCGAGIAGLTVARQLARGGWEVTVVESASARRDQGYMIDFFGPGFETAEQIGLLPRLRELAYPIDKVTFIDDGGRERYLDYQLVARSQGGKLLSLMRPDLELALFESLPSSVDVRFGKTLTSVTDSADAVTAGFEDGSQLRADILVAADGIHSTVRAQVFGPEERFARQLGYHTCAYIFDSPSLHEKLGRRWGLTDTIDRMAGLYALRDGRVAVFGAHRVDDVALPADRRSAVLEAYSTLGWHVPEALAHCPEEFYYDQVAQIEIERWSSGRVVLLGDACQAVSLLAGQGASLAVAGGQLLARELLAAFAPAASGSAASGSAASGSAASATASISAAFARYEQQWMPVVVGKQAAGRRSAASFLPHSRFALLMRRVGLAAMQLPGIGRLVSSRVVGKQGAVLQ